MAQAHSSRHITIKLLVSLVVPWLVLALALWIVRIDAEGVGDLSQCANSVRSTSICLQDQLTLFLLAPFDLFLLHGENGAIAFIFFLAAYPVLWVLTFVGWELSPLVRVAFLRLFKHD